MPRHWIVIGLFGLTGICIASSKPGLCPKPDVKVQNTCQIVPYDALPEEAQTLISAKCDSIDNLPPRPWIDRIDLNGDGTPEFHLCCHYRSKETCESIVIGKQKGEWTTLGTLESEVGIGLPCTGLTVLSEMHERYHDLCIPYWPRWKMIEGLYRQQKPLQ